MTTTLPPPSRALSREEKLALLARRLAVGPAAGDEQPLSSAQARLWVLEQMTPGTPIYNIPARLRLVGKLDPHALDRSLEAVIHRHAILRTTYESDGGQPRVRVAPHRPFRARHLDLRPLEDAVRAAVLAWLARDEALRPCDLRLAPLVRAVLARVADEEHVLMLTLHHIAMDGWSLRLLVREIEALYPAFAHGRPSPLPPPALQYAEAAALQARRLQGARFDELLASWRRELEGAPTDLPLPYDRPRPPAQAQRFHGARITAPVDPAVAARLRALAEEQGATLFMVLLAGFQALLHRYTGRRDLLIGTPVLGRTLVEVEDVLGLFVNTLVLRGRPAPGLPFRELVSQARAAVLRALSHQELPFEKLVETLQPERALGRNPLFDVMFALHTDAFPTVSMDGVHMEFLEPDPGTAKFDLCLTLVESPGRLTSALQYSTELFLEPTAEGLLRQYHTLLAGAAARPHARLCELPLDHEPAALGPASAGEEALSGNPVAPLEARAARAPDAPAVVDGEHVVDTRTLHAWADHMARRLGRLGAGPETRVALVGERSPEALAGLLGVLKAGAACLPLDPSLPHERLRGLVSDARAALILCPAAARERCAGLGPPVLELDPAAPEGGDPPARARPAQPDNLAWVPYGTGSPGAPVGVLVTRGALACRAARMARRLALGPADRVLPLASPAFEGSAEWIFAAWLGGGAVVLGPGRLPAPGDELHALIDRARATVISLPASYWHEWVLALERAPGFPASLRLVVVGGPPASSERFACWRERAPPGVALLNTYGAEECTATATVFSPGASEDAAPGWPLPIGTPLGHVRACLLDEGLRPVPRGALGELYLGGPALARGYLGAPALTAERFLPDPLSSVPGSRLYRSGDRARLGAAGALLLREPAEAEVKVRRPGPGAADAQRGAPPGVRDPAPPGDAARAPDAPPAEGPRSALEAALAGLWTALLGRAPARLDDDFFALGGHSLLAVRLAAQLHKAFGVELPPSAVFGRLTLRGLAQAIEEARGARGAPPAPIARTERSGPLPLSSAQARLWFLEQLSPDVPVYALPFVLRLRGRLDPAALGRALDELVRRHEVLRTRIALQGGQPMQWVEAPRPWPLDTVSLEGLDEDAFGREVDRRARAEARRPLDLGQAPPVRAGLFRRGDDDHALLLVLHHVSADGWALSLLLEDLSRLYAAFRAGRASPLAEPALQYGDFVAWQARRLAEGALDHEIAYWRRQLEKAPATLPLPSSRGRAERADGDSAGGRCLFRLSAATAERARALARAEEATPFMVLLAAFEALLFRVSGQTDFTLGTPVAGRGRPELERVVGMFSNTVVLRARVTGPLRFRSLLGAARRTALEAFAHQEVPFERVVEAVRPERTGAENPLFRVMFSLPNVPRPPGRLGDVRLEVAEVETPTAKLDLSLTLLEQEPSGLLGAFEYRAAAVGDEDAQQLAASYATLLEAALAAPDTRVADLPLLDGAARARLLACAQGEARALPALSVHAQVEARAREDGGRSAIADAASELRYAELDERAARLAGRLRALGVGPEVRVAVCAGRSPETLVALLAVLKAGGGFAALDPNQPARRLERAFRQVGARVLITDRDGRGLPRPEGLSVLALDAEETWAATPLRPAVEPHPEALAYVVCTSGTTGEPRAVGVPHRALANHALEARRRFGLGPEDRVLQFASLGFDVALEEIFPTWLAGATLVLRPEDPPAPGDAFTRWLDEAGVTVVNLPASYWQEWAPTARVLPPRLRLAVVGSEPMRREALESWARLTRVPLLNAYGTSESTITSTSQDAAEALEASPVPIGHAWANVRALALDQHLEPVPPGVAGELYLGGPGVARGYLGRPDLTAERFLPDPFGAPGGRLYRTGDRVRRLRDGALQFAGRVDHQVKLRGLRLEPDEVAATLAEHPRLRAALVVACGAGDALRLVAYHVPLRGAPTAEELRGFLRERLPAAFIPNAFVGLDAFPLTPGGKIDREALPEPDAPGAAPAFVAPSTPEEIGLAALWRELLHVPRAGVGDDFFALGGHSLLAVRLSARIEEVFGLHVPLRALFERPTLGAQARLLAGSPGTQLAPVPGVEADPTGRFEPFPLTELQEAYWVGRTASFELGGVSAHGYQEIDCEGLDLPRYEAAWRRLIERHDMLRAVVRPDGRQQVLEHVRPFEVLTEDLRGLPAEAAERRLAEVRAEMSHQVLRADQWPLFQLRASRLPDRTRLHVSFDALIADDLSWQTLERELVQLYRQPDLALPPLGLIFRDYVLAEERFRRGDAHRRAVEYWRARAAELPPPPELPLKVPLASVSQPTFRRLRRTLAPASAAALKARGAERGCTPSALLLAAFGEALAVYSRSARFCIALTRFHRLPLHPQVDRIVGDFTRVALLELDQREAMPFQDRARRVQARLWEDLEHASAGGVALLRELGRRHGVPPVVPVVFTSTLGQGGGGALLQLGRPVYSISQTPQVLLDYQVFEYEGALMVNWDAVAEVFPDGLLQDLADAHFGLLERLSGDAAAWEAPVTGLVPARQLAVRARANATSRPGPELTLHQLFLAQVSARRHAPAVLGPARTLDYGELEARSAEWARRLVQLGLRRGERVAVVMEKGWEQAVAALGILRAGGAYVPLDPRLPRPRLQGILRQAEARLSLTQPRWQAALAWPAGTRPLPVLDAPPAPAALAPVPAPLEAGPDDLAYVMYTSGSTGVPKGVMISHRGAVNTIVELNRRLEVGADDRVLSLSSFGFDLSVYDLFGLLAAGGAMVLPDAGAEQDPAHWAARLAEARVTLWNSVPALMELLLEQGGGRADPARAPLRWVLLSGDKVALTLPERTRRLFPRAHVLSLGGATEASIWSIAFPCDERDPAWSAWPYGRPLANQSFHVLDERLEERPDWVPGELCIGGMGLALGYLGDAEQTRRCFVVHPRTGQRLYRTGDAGYAWPDGTIQILGRLDQQVKVRGFRIELGEIESALQQHPGVREAAAAVREEPSGERRLVAYVVPQGEAPSSAAVREFLRERLPAYMLPSFIGTLERLPLGANGKIDRRALAAREIRPVATGAGAGVEGARRVAALVARVLGCEAVEPGASLLDLGATSVDIIRLLNLMEAELGFRPRVDAVYAEPTPEALAALWRRAQPPSPALAPPREPSALILDEAQREAFREAWHGIRREDVQRPRVALPEGKRPGLERRTHREFATRPVPLEALAGLLERLRQWDEDGRPRYLYGSAGGLYPVQVYLHAKAERVEGVAGGSYYYHPLEHRLVALEPGVELPAEIHERFWNRPIFERAAFSLLCVARMSAIEPLYGEQSLHFATLETGALCQLLEQSAVALGLGLCQIGGADFEPVRALFHLRPDDRLIHTLVGGLVPDPDGFEEGEL